jgi:hypothetical protein
MSRSTPPITVLRRAQDEREKGQSSIRKREGDHGGGAIMWQHHRATIGGIGAFVLTSIMILLAA